jgi:serine phosphatase RsbU (regulator of sigma subunit)
VEASNGQKDMYGEQRLVQALRELHGKTPREQCALILEQVQVFSKDAEYSDDKTLVVIKRLR